MADNQSIITTMTTLSLDSQKSLDFDDFGCDEPNKGIEQGFEEKFCSDLDQNHQGHGDGKEVPSGIRDEGMDSVKGSAGACSPPKATGSGGKESTGKESGEEQMDTEVLKAPADAVRRMSSKGAKEEDYFIAADLTLYSNPLNNALHIVGRSAPPPKHHGPQKAPKKDGEEEEEEETIAADMTKYDSPMADLDKRRNDKQEEHK